MEETDSLQYGTRRTCGCTGSAKTLLRWASLQEGDSGQRGTTGPTIKLQGHFSTFAPYPVNRSSVPEHCLPAVPCRPSSLAEHTRIVGLAKSPVLKGSLVMSDLKTKLDFTRVERSHSLPHAIRSSEVLLGGRL